MTPRTKTAACWLLLGLFAMTAVAADSRLEAVEKLRGDGRTGAALDRLHEAFGQRPDDPEAALLEGVLLAELGRTKEAEKVFEELIAKSPDSPEPYNNLAVLYAAGGDNERAIETLKRGLKTHPSYGTTYENLTRVYGKMASLAYNRALGQQAEETSAPVQLALLDGLTSRTPAASEPGPRAGTPAAAPPRLPATPEPAAPVEIEQAAAVSTPPTTVPAAPAAEPTTGRQPATGAVPASGPEPTRIPSTVEAWARAWSEQDVASYLGHYSGRFRPPGGESRAEWEALRRERLEAPDFIRVSVAFLGVEEAAEAADRGGQATVRFIQSYESDRFSDTVTKALDLAWEDGRWKILEERVEG